MRQAHSRPNLRASAHTGEPADYHHHANCGTQCDAAIAIAISVPTVKVVLATLLGASVALSFMPYLNMRRTLSAFVKANTMIATTNANMEGVFLFSGAYSRGDQIASEA
jgi:hypothetical protein